MYFVADLPTDAIKLDIKGSLPPAVKKLLPNYEVESSNTAPGHIKYLVLITCTLFHLTLALILSVMRHWENYVIELF